jgi:hypothetical protein
MAGTVARLAQELGTSERNVFRLRKAGTPSHAIAEKFAAHFGGAAEDYLRDVRPRGRPAQAKEAPRYTFHEFINDCIQNDNAEQAAMDFSNCYFAPLGSLIGPPPETFASLEQMLSFMTRSGAFCDDARRDAFDLWKQFRIWQVREECAERILAIELEE